MADFPPIFDLSTITSRKRLIYIERVERSGSLKPWQPQARCQFLPN